MTARSTPLPARSLLGTIGLASLAAAIAVGGCAPPPRTTAPILSELSDVAAGEREVLTLDGVEAESAIAVPDEGGITLFVATTANGENSMLTTHSKDGVHFGPTRPLTFKTGLHSVLDVMLDGTTWRALHTNANNELQIASSTDGVHFDDDVKVDVVDAAGRQLSALPSRLVHLDDGYHLYFTGDRSGACSDVGCFRAVIDHASASDLSGHFAAAADVLADPPEADACTGCNTDVWMLVDMVRAGAARCATAQPTLAVLRPLVTPGTFSFDLDAVGLDKDDVTASTPQELSVVNDLKAGFFSIASVVATETTLAVYTRHLDQNSPLRGHVRVTVISAPDEARLVCR